MGEALKIESFKLEDAFLPSLSPKSFRVSSTLCLKQIAASNTDKQGGLCPVARP